MSISTPPIWETEIIPAPFFVNGIQCVIKRGPSGHLCGYCQLPEVLEKLFTDYNDAPFDVHGGITFGGTLKGYSGQWLGFDCAHGGDYSPGYPAFPGDVYRTVEYVTAECTKLAGQIAAFQNSPVPPKLQIARKTPGYYFCNNLGICFVIYIDNSEQIHQVNFRTWLPDGILSDDGWDESASSARVFSLKEIEA